MLILTLILTTVQLKSASRDHGHGSRFVAASNRKVSMIIGRVISYP